MKQFAITTALILAVLLTYAQTIDKPNPIQTHDCLTPDIDTTEFQQLPWFDNNDFLEHFIDSIGYPNSTVIPNRIVGAPNVKYWIPIKFWVHRNDNGTGGPILEQLQLLVDKLNSIYNQQNNTWIGFYMKCDVTDINNTTLMNPSLIQASLSMLNNKEFGCFNVHIVDALPSNVAGFALKPIGSCIINRASYLSADNYTIPHEVGHLLGLVHTHIFWDWQIKCFRECVSRTRTWPLFNFCIANRIRSRRVCESTGDGLRDTPADPRLLNNFTCAYTPQSGIWENDLWGDSYSTPPNGPQEIPSTSNVMSYQGADACVNNFSRLQIGVMLYNLIVFNSVNGTAWSKSIHEFDSFEPNNQPEIARTITLGELQERNFHQQFNNLFGNPLITQCDVDWVRFVAPCSGVYNITTGHMANRIDANTRLTLFDGTGTNQLAQNDNISATNLFSNITWNFNGLQTYLIRIENMQNLVTGYYNLVIGDAGPTQIDGDASVCGTSNAYTVHNLQAGSNVTWSVAPAGIANLSCTSCNSPTLTRVTDGQVTLTASVNNGCATYLPIVRQVNMINPYTTQLVGGFSTATNTYPLNTVNFVPIGNIYAQYQWGGISNLTASLASGSPSGTGFYSFPYMFSFNIANNQVITINITGDGLCGAVSAQRTFIQYTHFSITASPNPASNNINVTVTEVVDTTLPTNLKMPLVSNTSGVTKMYLYDFNSSILVKEWSYLNIDAKNYSLNIAGLKTGYYILKMERDNKISTTKVFIQ